MGCKHSALLGAEEVLEDHCFDLMSFLHENPQEIEHVNNCVASGGGCPGCRGASTLAQPAPRQSCAPMAGKPVPSSHEPPHQWNQAPVTLIQQWKNKGGEGWG